MKTDIRLLTSQALILYRLQRFQYSRKKRLKREDLKNALKEMMDHNGSYLLEVMVGKENNVFPMVPQGRGVAEIVLCKEEFINRLISLLNGRIKIISQIPPDMKK